MLRSQGPMVLVVDDEPLVLGVLAAMVAHCGCTPVTARDGPRALGVYRDRRAEIAVVVLEVQMREMDGPATLGALREITPELPCVFVNGDGADYTTAELRGLGCVTVLNKPHVLSDLKWALAAAIQQRVQATGAVPVSG